MNCFLLVPHATSEILYTSYIVVWNNFHCLLQCFSKMDSYPNIYKITYIYIYIRVRGYWNIQFTPMIHICYPAIFLVAKVSSPETISDLNIVTFIFYRYRCHYCLIIWFFLLSFTLIYLNSIFYLQFSKKTLQIE